METVRKEHKLCICCMEEHEVALVRVQERKTYKGISVGYEAMYEYCDKADEYFSTDDMITNNYNAMKKAYSEITTTQ